MKNHKLKHILGTLLAVWREINLALSEDQSLSVRESPESSPWPCRILGAHVAWWPSQNLYMSRSTSGTTPRVLVDLQWWQAPGADIFLPHHSFYPVFLHREISMVHLPPSTGLYSHSWVCCLSCSYLLLVLKQNAFNRELKFAHSLIHVSFWGCFFSLAQ